MNHAKRILQLTFLFAIIWLTIQNYAIKVDLKIFNKDIKAASVILVVFFSIVLGSLIATFFASIKDMKRVGQQKRLTKENKKQTKEILELQKDIKILTNDVTNSQKDNEKKDSEIKTLKEIINMPDNEISRYSKDHLIS